MLNLDGPWTRRRGRQVPFAWTSTKPGELLHHDAARALACAFPEDGLDRIDASQRVGEKRYRNFSRTIVVGADSGPGLPEPWRELIEDLADRQYREAVAAVLNQELAASLEIRLVCHGVGDWLDPHTDRPDKLFSHIIYLNEGWREEWGGCLEILASSDPSALVERVVPELGASALLAPGPNSWHQVSRVRGTPPASRRSVLIHGLRSPTSHPVSLSP